MGVGEAIQSQDSNAFGWTNGVTALWGRVSPEGLYKARLITYDPQALPKK